MGHLGFSYVGLIYLLMLFIPNIIWSRKLPSGYTAAGENQWLRLLERVGQTGCTVAVLIFSDYNLRSFSIRSLWLVASFTLMLLYELCWLRYFLGGRTEADFYKSFLGVPLPLATLPVAAFLLLGIYGGVIWLIASAAMLGIGHIGIHAGHLKDLRGKNGGQ